LSRPDGACQIQGGGAAGAEAARIRARIRVRSRNPMSDGPI